MDNSTLVVVISVVVNVAVVAFSYGKLSQKVAGLCERMVRLEKHFNSKEVK